MQLLKETSNENANKNYLRERFLEKRIAFLLCVFICMNNVCLLHSQSLNASGSVQGYYNLTDTTSSLNDYAVALSLEKHRCFVVGEYHNTRGNDKAFDALLDFFILHHNIRHVILELPVSCQDYFNAFVLRGNRDSLKKIGNINKELRHRLNTIREKNKILPEDKKLNIICVDVELNHKTPITVISKFLTPGEKSMLNLTFLPENKISNKAAKELSVKLINEFKVNSILLKEKLTIEKYEKLKKIIEGIIIGADYDFQEKLVTVITPEKKLRDSLFLLQREIFLTNRMLEILDDTINQKSIGFFGKAHISSRANIKTDEIANWNSMVVKLNDKLTVNGVPAICAIDIVYLRFLRDELARLNASEEFTNKLLKIYGSGILVDINSSVSSFYMKNGFYHFLLLN